MPARTAPYSGSSHLQQNLSACSHGTPLAGEPTATPTLPDEAWEGLTIAFRFGGADADLTLFLTDAQSQVSPDKDFVFYNQPSAAHGAARLLGKQTNGTHTVERHAVHLTAPRAHPAHNDRDQHGRRHRPGMRLLTHAELSVACATASWTFQPHADPAIRAMVVAELYRHRSPTASRCGNSARSDRTGPTDSTAPGARLCQLGGLVGSHGSCHGGYPATSLLVPAGPQVPCR
ncbi:TerD family protein [Streptomyces caniferus]|uniref:TerD family protein n=1 Tax=Streptomyces caniferus TaxID=285557 RepID=UPI002E295D7A|nr:TerD family protein [Streptomyces caniferus]